MVKFKLDPTSPTGIATADATSYQPYFAGGPGKPSLIDSVNGKHGAVQITGGSNVTVDNSGNSIVISSSASGGGTTLPTDAAGWLHDNGSGTLAWTTPVKADVGLGNVDNTSDVNKPVSTAQQTALNLKAPLASPTFTGTPGFSGSSGVLSVYANPDGGEYNIGASASGKLAIFGSAAATLDLNLLDGALYTASVVRLSNAGVLQNTDLTGTGNTFPTFNQSTTGSAAKLTTARNIDGQAFDGSANITVIAPGTHAATSKTTPVDADEIPLVDSAASNVLAKLTWANLKATIKSYYDSLTTTLTNKTISGASNTLSNIGNTSLTNSSVTIGSTAVSLGGTAATLAGLTLTTPTIASFTNATHTHANAAGGGQLGTSALTNASITADKLATGGAAALVATSQTTTTTTYTDLTTSGPAVTVTIGANGLALIIVSAELFNVTAGGFAYMSQTMSGANTTAAADDHALFHKDSSTNGDLSASYAYLATGLAAGSTTFTAKYRTNTGTATFVNRRISVIPL